MEQIEEIGLAVRKPRLNALYPQMRVLHFAKTLFCADDFGKGFARRRGVRTYGPQRDAVR